MPISSDSSEHSNNYQWQYAFLEMRGGSSDALGELLEGCRQYLLLVANEELDSTLTAKVGGSDIVQEALMSAGANVDQFQGVTREDFLRWLRRILLNQIVTHRRQYLKSQKRQVHREVPLDHDRFHTSKGELTSTLRSPSSFAALRENSQIVRQSLARLPAHYQQVIVLRHRDRLTFADVGRRLELSGSGARQLWARAIKALRKEFISGCRSKKSVGDHE